MVSRASRSSSALAAATALCAGAGCATIETLDGRVAREWSGSVSFEVPRLYSGTCFDAKLLSIPNENFAIVDLPFSLVADTLVVPYTLYTQWRYGNLRFDASPLAGDANPPPP